MKRGARSQGGLDDIHFSVFTSYHIGDHEGPADIRKGQNSSHDEICKRKRKITTLFESGIMEKSTFYAQGKFPRYVSLLLRQPSKPPSVVDFRITPRLATCFVWFSLHGPRGRPGCQSRTKLSLVRYDTWSSCIDKLGNFTGTP